MPKVQANGITMNYTLQGTGEALVLIPYLSADCECYAFQIAEYAKHFTCITVDLRGAGETDKPDGKYSVELYADDVSAFMQAIRLEYAHVSGLSLGAAVGMSLAAKYPQKVKTLSVHCGWTKTDPFIKTVVEGWQVLAKALGSVPEMVIKGIFPWCFTPEFYASKPEYIEMLSAFVRSRPPQPLECFMWQSNAVISHDVEEQLSKITPPTQITFGRHDLITSTRFAEPMQSRIPQTELVVFEDCSHAPIYENTEEFNQRTIEFLKRHG